MFIFQCVSKGSIKGFTGRTRGRSASLEWSLKVSPKGKLPQTISSRRCVVDGSNRAGMFLELRGLRLEFQPQTSSATGATREGPGRTMQLVLVSNTRRVWARFRCVTAFGCPPSRKEAGDEEVEEEEESDRTAAKARSSPALCGERRLFTCAACFSWTSCGSAVSTCWQLARSSSSSSSRETAKSTAETLVVMLELQCQERGGNPWRLTL